MLKKFVGYGLLTLFVIAGTGFAYLYFREPASRPAKNIKVAMTPERIERGRYLFRLSDCQGCHTPHELKDGAVLAISDREASGQVFTENGMQAASRTSPPILRQASGSGPMARRSGPSAKASTSMAKPCSR